MADEKRPEASPWVRAEAARIRKEGAELTPDKAQQVARKFRTEFGGVYDVIADRIEADHLNAAVVAG